MRTRFDTATDWLPVSGRRPVCRRNGCPLPATDDIVELCPGHGGVSGAELPRNVGGRRVGLPVTPTLSMPGPWANLAACAKPTGVDFFSEARSEILRAKAICTGCPVVAECGQYALENDERFGVWGGLSEHDRRRLRKAPAA